MRILFCNIAWMRYYKGFWEGEDEPVGGGSFVDENQYGSELFNFAPFTHEDKNGKITEVCTGFVVTKMSRSGKDQALHIERLEGCEANRASESVEDVLVIYCAAHPFHNFTSVVGWYRDATVYRYYQEVIFETEDGGEAAFLYNALAPRENCVLLPVQERRPVMWKIPRRQTGASYGFGQANVWFAEGREENKLLDRFLTRIVNQIENYSGENWVDRLPESLVEETRQSTYQE